ncbi:NUDIX domain-containing protein [Rhodobacteraceae bacterium CCMM004]|nr:NUDIX domain-containing protein [Rhodobacteraceae bacterium CCMM004]
MIPRYGRPPEPGRRYDPRPGAYALLCRGDACLVTFQEAPAPEFQLPGGGVDPGEGPLRALHREVLEETGWTIVGARRLGAYRRFTYMPEYRRWAEKLCHVYLARPALCRGAPSEAGHSAVWMPLADAVRVLASAGDRAVAAAALCR